MMGKEQGRLELKEQGRLEVKEQWRLRGEERGRLVAEEGGRMGGALCRRSSFDPSRNLHGILFLITSYVTLINQNMIVLKISV